MDFELSDDQRALQDAAADLLGSLSTTEQVRAMAAKEEAFDGALWKAMVDQGWTGVELAEDQGGLGLGMVEAAVLAEQVGAHVAPAPFIENLLAAAALAGTEKEEWVERLVTGDAIACVAWRPDIPVAYAPVADVAVVIRDDDLALVELSGGPAIEREPALDLTRPLGWLRLAGRESATTTIGYREAATRLFDRGAALYSAALLGAAARVLDMATDYAKERVQFGKPIGSFQAVKHRCADMLVDVEGMRSTAYWAAWCLSAADTDTEDDKEGSIAASTAKTWCSDAARRVMASGLQVHGGIGFTWEHDLHLFLKRSQLDEVTFGDAAYHRERLGTLLRESLEATPPVC